MVDEVSNIIKESIENTIGGNGYAHAKVSQWTNAVVESCLASLTKLQKPFKYIGELLTVRKLQFSVSQILREIKVGDFRGPKSAIFTHLEALNFIFMKCSSF